MSEQPNCTFCGSDDHTTTACPMRIEAELEGWWNDENTVYTWPITMGEWGSRIECHGRSPVEAQALAFHVVDAITTLAAKDARIAELEAEVIRLDAGWHEANKEALAQKLAATPSEDGREPDANDEQSHREFREAGKSGQFDPDYPSQVWQAAYRAGMARIEAAKDAEIAHLRSARDAYGQNAIDLQREVMKLRAKPARQVGGDEWPKLESPAIVGNTTFRKGVSARLVVDRAYRQYEYLKQKDESRAALAPAAVVTEYRTYTTQPGESLAGIALRQLKDESRWFEIRDLNAHDFPDMRPHDYYPVGTVIRIARLNRNPIPVGLLERISKLFPEDMGDDGTGRAGWLPHVRDTVGELRALLAQQQEVGNHE